MKKILGLFCVMLLIFVVSGPVGATGNGNGGVFPGHGNGNGGVFPGHGNGNGGVFPAGGHVDHGFHGGGNGASVPEPATIILLGSGLVGLAGFGRKRFKK